MQTNEIELRTLQPPVELVDFVESFWMLVNHSKKEHNIVVLPDGRFDIIFYRTKGCDHKVVLKGLDTIPQQTKIPANTVFYSVSFKLLSIEYLLDVDVKSLINGGVFLPDDQWDINSNGLDNFDLFSNKISAALKNLIKPNIDGRKQQLFELIYSSNGTMPVAELSERVSWSSRQINRYFQQTFGIALKAYCNIFRFKSSLQHLKNGKLFPELNFTDQTHFIKEVKKMAGVTPKELSKNVNDRFILLSTI